MSVNHSTHGTPVSERANFDIIRYAQVWEDAEVLVQAMGDVQGGRLLSVCSAGDNALALLLLNPREVVAADLSMAQLECLHLRLHALDTLEHGEFLELMGSRPSLRRRALLDRALHEASASTVDFWMSKAVDVQVHGAAGIGKFERYFRIFRNHVLPLIQAKTTTHAVFEPRSPQERRHFFDTRWNTWRWKVATATFFSNFAMGRLGRDPSFFAYVQGSMAAQVRAKVQHAATSLDPAANPYMRWILTGTHGDALPLAWREESYGVLRARRDRITPFLGPVDATSGTFDGFNLSDIFEYMDAGETNAVYGRLLERANPGARLVYWNMMVPRRVPESLAGRMQTMNAVESRLSEQDKAFFYSALVIEKCGK